MMSILYPTGEKPSPTVKLLDSALTVIGATTLLVLIIVVLSLMMAFPVKWLVNWLFTPNAIQTVFGVTAISVWQAWGFNMLCGTLFGSKQMKST